MENVSKIVKQIQQYTDQPPEDVFGQLVDLWANWQSFARSIVPESSGELPDRVEAIERKFNHLLIQTNQKCDETLARVAEGERNTGAALQRIKDQFEKLFGGLSDRVSIAELKITAMIALDEHKENLRNPPIILAADRITPTITGTPTAPEPVYPEPIKTEEFKAEVKAHKAKQIDLEKLNLAQLRQLLTPNGLPQRLAPGSRYRNRSECLEVLGQLRDAGRLKS
jgi:hypothetical protein